MMHCLHLEFSVEFYIISNSLHHKSSYFLTVCVGRVFQISRLGSKIIWWRWCWHAEARWRQNQTGCSILKGCVDGQYVWNIEKCVNFTRCWLLNLVTRSHSLSLTQVNSFVEDIKWSAAVRKFSNFLARKTVYFYVIFIIPYVSRWNQAYYLGWAELLVICSFNCCLRFMVAARIFYC